MFIFTANHDAIRTEMHDSILRLDSFAPPEYVVFTMKKPIILTLSLLAAMLLLNGCIAAIGNGETARNRGTIGQQLIDLQKAKEAGALTEAEFQVEKEKLLGKKGT